VGGPAELGHNDGAQCARDQARRDLFQYIEGFYNPRHLHSALGHLSPPAQSVERPNPVHYSGEAL
jgi:hypothetical protein